ncbi:unnamed protein product [marine sediment metagenome]|uniref:Radical SAM core domain-containing protein n=1 Tax=marine sediment metagenome TaxID=412755 RepID=X1RER1_9ZZZZ
MCVEACLSEARVISGRTMTVDEVVEIVRKDELFYRNSGGGVTASGGEPTYQPDFLKQLLRQCQSCGIHTTLDTCGHVKWEVMAEILDYVDLVYYDLKHMDTVRHGELTGVGNELILDNATRIPQSGKPIVIRIPLIPGCNDSEENIKTMAEFVTGIKVVRVDIVPFHQLGVFPIVSRLVYPFPFFICYRGAASLKVKAIYFFQPPATEFRDRIRAILILGKATDKRIVIDEYASFIAEFVKELCHLDD